MSTNIYEHLSSAMGSSILFNLDYLYYKGDSDVWNDQPTTKGTILYSIITPTICLFGIFGNTLSLMVLKRRELMGSVYTYLAVLAASDLLMSFMLFFGGLSRGVLYYRGWATYDALVGLPLGGAINTLSVIATVAVTIDRVLYLWNPVQCTKPKFCNRIVARKIMAAAVLLSILLNLPYCFIFTWSDEGVLVTTYFFDSVFYTAFNWFMLTFFSIMPGIVLIFGNGFLIMSLKKARKITVKCNGKRKDHTNLTITLISIIVLFLVSEVPATLVSRTNAVPILFSGNHEKARSTTLEIVRQVCTLLGAVNVTVNFLFYYLFCPAFVKALIKTFQRKKRIRKSLQVNVFVLNGDRMDDTDKKTLNKKMKARILEISRKSMESSFPSSLNFVEDVNEKGSENDLYFENCTKRVDDSEYVEIVDDYRLPMPKYSIIVEESSVESSTVVNGSSKCS
ncbi:uncharacterized protein LOC108907939 [Anoplophora glabripennis]|uniref:uncharacterized protein LOC108907939 n=1 Tax=Anoplophora glabripennis TaxID=217634 RepID=UPI0008738AC9|nr:uncharacterized protein LOC108907939 [Anoplophora glabripennis]